MATRHLLLFTALVACSIGYEGYRFKIGNAVPICPARGSHLKACLLNSAQQMLPRLKEVDLNAGVLSKCVVSFKAHGVTPVDIIQLHLQQSIHHWHPRFGIPDWGFPFMDPLKVPVMAIEKGTGQLGFNITLIEAMHYGLSTIRFISVDPDPENFAFNFKVWLPTYSIVGHYEMNGRLLLLPITGKGESNITLSNLTAEWSLRGRSVIRDEQEYMELTQFRVKVFPERVKVKFDNLFNGNKYLGMGNTMNNFLNAHWKELFRELRPALEEAISQLHKSLAEKIFAAVPYSDMFPDLYSPLDSTKENQFPSISQNK